MKLLIVTALVMLSTTFVCFAHQSTSSTTPRERDRAREAARRIITERVMAAWLKSETKESLDLIVLNADAGGRVYRSEFRKVFPEGSAHLPETLTPRVIYCTTPACTRAVQHLGRAEQDGFKFILLRWLPRQEEAK